MGFVKDHIEKALRQRALLGLVPIVFLLCLSYIFISASIRANQYPTITLDQILNQPPEADKYVEIPVIDRYEPTLDVLALKNQKPVARFVHLYLGDVEKQEDPGVILAKIPCGPRTEKSQCSFSLPSRSTNAMLARGWLLKAKSSRGSIIRDEFSTVVSSLEQSKEEKKLRKKVEKIRLAYVLDGVSTAPGQQAFIYGIILAVFFISISAAIGWAVYPRDYKTSSSFIDISKVERRRYQIEAEVDAEMKSTDPLPVHVPGGAILTMSYVIFARRFSLKIHYVGDVATFKLTPKGNMWQASFHDKSGTAMFGFVSATFEGARELVQDLLARRDMIKESEKWREAAKARANREKAKEASREEKEAERKRKEQAAGENYKVLGLAPGASAEEVLKAWRKIALKWHPDRHTNPDVKAQAEPIFKRATQAKEELIALLKPDAENEKDK